VRHRQLGVLFANEAFDALLPDPRRVAPRTEARVLDLVARKRCGGDMAWMAYGLLSADLTAPLAGSGLAESVGGHSLSSLS
jgi:hypothetical protein